MLQFLGFDAQLDSQPDVSLASSHTSGVSDKQASPENLQSPGQRKWGWTAKAAGSSQALSKVGWPGDDWSVLSFSLSHCHLHRVSFSSLWWHGFL